jgi:hypothetical protein
MNAGSAATSETSQALQMIRIMERLAALFKKLTSAEEKLQEYRTGEAGKVPLPTLIQTEVQALAVCALISGEIRKAEQLLNNGGR